MSAVAPTPALARELLAYGRAHLAPYKTPRILEFVAELPKTSSGKIRRVELRARSSGAGGVGEFFYEKTADWPQRQARRRPRGQRRAANGG